MRNNTLLSEREKDVLQLVAAGLTNREIAQQLSISPNTVKVHLRKIFEKAGVVSRTEATLFAIEHGYVQVPGGGAAESPQNTSVRGFLKQTLWIWVAILFLIGVALFTVLSNASNRNTISTDEMAYTEMERWQELTPLPEPRTGMAAVAYDGNIFIIAGEGPDGVSGEVFTYDIESDIWTVASEKPTPVTDVDGVLIGEKIYVPGGKGMGDQPVDILEIYDPRKDVWETGAPLPKSLSAYALANFEGKLYLFGGWDGRQAQNYVMVYDPILNYWYEGTPLPKASYYLGAVALEGKIVILGGRDGKDNLRQAWAYYPPRDVSGETPWEPFIVLPNGRSAFGVASIYDSIYVFGGEGERQTGSYLEEWLLIGEDWITLPVNHDYGQRQIKLIPMGSLLVVIDPSEMSGETKLWTYEAFYYSVYIPITR